MLAKAVESQNLVAKNEQRRTRAWPHGDYGGCGEERRVLEEGVVLDKGEPEGAPKEEVAAAKAEAGAEAVVATDLVEMMGVEAVAEDGEALAKNGSQSEAGREYVLGDVAYAGAAGMPAAG